MKKENKKTKASAIDMTEENKIRQIEALRDTINSAEKTIQSAKAMLLNLEGKKKAGRRRKVDEEYAESNIIQGTFDGQIMVGTDGKQYPVPANYASKSKLVEGDMLKLTISSNGSFIYKQIGPAERKNIIGIIGQDENENYFVIAEGKPYRILLASITYFKIEPGDEVVIVVPKNINSEWAAIENVLQKGTTHSIPPIQQLENNHSDNEHIEVQENNESQPEEKDALEDNHSNSDMDDWALDIEEIKKEIEKEKAGN
ncbi:MAG: 50S ribosomal protein L7/L12 [Candidatus Moranbacteria bacterium GW2011_GWE2_35_2-]|nr:MAG: 50S ribosomal protein L7/L12 [Candidatus Moranbacteria bacterium GW2011_GWE2_35_2-]KKQ21993.1 MAG: 50S ribosomal protein L7/L12 [Candidatus Moranbacteria bacterium GW2011_GWF2_37_11]KKQ29115.1 MAG: 50S ribosomal protein L7/L12 [Candidatus Moranbacteria bacterium GW2011_GWD1_37_17]KKQ31100.1 MAG: 50S ribosomal protein L7/L12 [Candidatus Moranbacteria bacterium GW2011_GWE1_37_24]KKQ46897.1 MAG: 50S ribosomal protein L7/L12 [Candidatus Moranbacteria bacterium GW2011_GWD2_37_9]